MRMDQTSNARVVLQYTPLGSSVEVQGEMSELLLLLTAGVVSLARQQGTTESQTVVLDRIFAVMRQVAGRLVQADHTIIKDL